MNIDAKLRRELARAVCTADRCILHARVRPCLVCAGCESCAERIADSLIKALKDSSSHKGRALRAILMAAKEMEKRVQK